MGNTDSKVFEILSELLDIANEQQIKSKKIALPTVKGVHVFSVSNIIRCESERNYTKIYCENEDPLFVAKSLKEFEDQLSKYHFERIHNSHLINLNHVKKYVNTRGGYIVMTDNSVIPVAQRKKNQVLSLLKLI